MSILKPTRKQLRELEKNNLQWPYHLVRVPEEKWPPRLPWFQKHPVEVWRSRDFLVQVFAESEEIERLSVCTTTFDAGRWVDGIKWDDLQRIKRETGRAAMDAVEVYPADTDVANVANMRHLWVFKTTKLPFVWRKTG